MTTRTMAFKTNEETRQALIKEAGGLKITPSKLINEKISTTTPLSSVSRDTLERLATAFKVNQSQIMDILITDFAAKWVVEHEVFGESLYDIHPFMFDMGGRMIKGGKLFVLLKKAYFKEILTDSHLMKKMKIKNERKDL